MTSIRSCRLALVLLAACALVVIACNGSSENQAPAAAPVTIEAVSPRGPVDWPFAFEWKTSEPPTTACRVTVFDEAERQLLEFDAKGRRADAPEDLRKLLATTRRFVWKVSVVREGEVLAQSSLVPFEVR